MQRVEHLALVFVQTLGLYVKEEIGIDRHFLAREQHVAEIFLIGALDAGEFFAERRVVFKGQQFPQAFRLPEPFVADGLAEFFRHDLMIVPEGVVLENFAVHLAHAVDGIAHGDAQVGHLHHVVGGDRHARNARVRAVMIEIGQPFADAAVDLLKDHINARHERADHFFRPALKRLAHDGMVGIRDGFLHDGGRFVPAKPFFVNQ